jgi:DNA-binding transcriptional MerR regulator
MPGKYRIGTVAQLTGLSPDTIRAWERRYETVVPSRSEGGTRLYTDEDVLRLQLMKALTDCGEAIGAIASLPDEDLRTRLARHAPEAPVDLLQPAAVGGPPPRVAVLDAFLSEQLRANPAELVDLELAVSGASLGPFLAELRESRADVLVLNLAALGSEPEAALDECLEASGARAAVVLFDFAPRRRLLQLAGRGVRLVKGPVSAALVRRSVLDFLAIRRARAGRAEPLDLEAPVDDRRPPPSRTFSDRQLARLREVRSSLDCECPNHLSSIIGSLLAFERYSESCQVEHPEDAALHALLARGSGHARSIVARLLTRLCEHDGIRL